MIPVAGKEQMSEFGHLFRERASKNLTDGHLWFSVIARPPQSRFTRCQRVSCCLCLLFMTMLANAMFYQTGSSSANAYTFGPFALTPEQVRVDLYWPLSFRADLERKHPWGIQTYLASTSEFGTYAIGNLKWLC